MFYYIYELKQIFVQNGIKLTRTQDSMKSSVQKNRPKHLDLLRIKLPITGIVSIAHRISGVLLVLSIPFWLYLLERSISGPTGFAEVENLLDGFFVSLLAIIVLWALVHHFWAGIRFLLLDLDIGIEKQQALKFAKVVFIVEAVSMIFVIGWVI